MNNKGLTLIELLETLIILSIISLIVVSNITDDVKDKKTEITKYQEEVIKEAAESYVADYINDQSGGSEFICGPYGTPYNFSKVDVNTLITNGYLSEKYNDMKYNVNIKCETRENNRVYTYEIQKQ